MWEVKRCARDCQGGVLLVIGFVLLSLWGCGGSGGTSGGSTGATSINVVFPGQQAALSPNDLPDVMTPRESVPRLALTALLTHLKGLYEVRAAYAQVVPADVSSLLLLITGPGIPAPIAANIDMATGRVTVNVPVGNDRVFEVRAFPAGSSTPNFIGRTMAKVSPRGTNVAVNMQAVNLRPPVVSNPGNQSTPEGSTVSLQIGVSDPDGDGLNCSASGLPPGLSIDPASCLISGTSPSTAAGTFTVTLTVSDGILDSSITFAWAVLNANRAPVVNSPGNQNNRGRDAVLVQITATDPDGDPLTFGAVNLPLELSIDPTTGHGQGEEKSRAGYQTSMVAAAQERG